VINFSNNFDFSRTGAGNRPFSDATENIPWWGKNILRGGEANERLWGKIY